jgi:uncharacterized protein with beta-barrel porin domain
MNPLLQKEFTAGGTILPSRIVKHGATDYEVVQASANSDLLIGVAELVYGRTQTNIGEGVTVLMAGTGQVEYGGTVTRGQRLTSDADGRAVPITTASQVCVGVALNSGTVGTFGEILISLGE